MPKKIQKNVKKPLAALYVPDDDLAAQIKVKKEAVKLANDYRLAYRNPNLFQPEYLVKDAVVAFIPDREKDQHVVKAYEKAKIKTVLLKVPQKEQDKAKE